jgi:hypothetical protein
MRHLLFCGVLALAGTVQAQMPLPAFGNTFTATLTRGFWFQAPTTFFITGLRVPNEANQAWQVVEVINFGATPPPTWPTVLPGTQLFYDNSTPAGTIIPASILINAGDHIGILGACTSFIGSTTSYNSYGTPAGPFVSDILGLPTTITRFGTQFGISAGGNNPCWTEPAAQLSRVEVYVSPAGGGTVATNTTLGQGCIREYASFYESFATAAAFDLSNTTLTLLPSGSGGYVGLTGIGSFLPVGSVGTPTSLTLSDDSEVTVPFTTGSFPGWTSFTVCSNGYVSKATGNGTAWTPTVATFLNASQDGFWCWHDFNPAAAGSGQVKVEQSASVTTITWDGVYDFGGTSAANANTWQLQLHASGQVVFAWQQMSGLGNGYLVGYSPGGPNQDPGSMDISSTPAFTIYSSDITPLTLAATTRPKTGTSWSLTVGNIPATTVFGVMIGGGADPGILDLGFLGMPTCQLRASLDALAAFTPAGSSFPFSLGVPNNPALVNAHVFLQSAVFQLPPVNAFGAITSNGIDGKIGDL